MEGLMINMENHTINLSRIDCTEFWISLHLVFWWEIVRQFLSNYLTFCDSPPSIFLSFLLVQVIWCGPKLYSTKKCRKWCSHHWNINLSKIPRGWSIYWHSAHPVRQSCFRDETKTTCFWKMIEIPRECHQEMLLPQRRQPSLLFVQVVCEQHRHSYGSRYRSLACFVLCTPRWWQSFHKAPNLLPFLSKSRMRSFPVKSQDLTLCHIPCSFL